MEGSSPLSGPIGSLEVAHRVHRPVKGLHDPLGSHLLERDQARGAQVREMARAMLDRPVLDRVGLGCQPFLAPWKLSKSKP